jgi:hypothetical protein
MLTHSAPNRRIGRNGCQNRIPKKRDMNMGHSFKAGRIAAGLFLVSTASVAHAADTLYPSSVAPIALKTNSYSQNFDTLASSGTSSVLPTGWQAFEGGTNGNNAYAANNGSSNAGTIYSYGLTGNSDRALGSLASGTLAPIYYGALFTNAIGSAITGLNFGYTGEQWRAADGNDSLTFQYSFNATSVISGSWTTITSLTFLTPNSGAGVALNGNLAANQQALSGSLSGLSIADGSTFGIRWFDQNSLGSDDGLAVDNFTMSALNNPVGAVPEPSIWAMMIGGFGIIGSSLRRRRRQSAETFVTA